MSRNAAQPFWIESDKGALFAWHHPPVDVVREAAVILCRPFGYDAQCSYRAYRHLAERLSDAGFHVLRLDYHGTGDSSGGDCDEDRVSTWVNSVRAGMDWVRSKLGVQRIALFGLRFGALIAHKASWAGDVDALVLFAPPMSGRAWLREARALQALVGAAGAATRAPPTDGSEECAGFLLTASTVDALSKLDPLAVEQSARAVLVIARDDLPGGEERLVSKLRARGVDVTLSKAPGYGAIMQHDPHRSVVPDAAWNETTAWLSARYPAAPQARSERVSYPRSASVRENEGAPTVREEALDMGGLFGVLTEPVDDSRAGVLPAIVLHNIGANSHIGANRMYVAMSRRWAAMGFRVLRFDTAGLGDSPSNARVSENRVYSGGVTEDSRRAMDFLGRARSTRRFILVGLCSGAYVAFHAAVTDDRVAGIVLMNIQLFDWKEGDSVDVRMRDVVKSTSFYSRALVGAETWMRLLRGDVNVNVIVRGLVHKGWERTRHSLARSLRGPSTVAQAFRSMTKRGTDVLVVCGADDGGRDVIDAHLGTNALLMQHDPHFRFEILEGTDHTFSPRWAQEKLLSLLTRHLESHFAEDRVPPAPLVTSIHDVK